MSKPPPKKLNCIIELGNAPISTRVEQWKTMAPSHSLWSFLRSLCIWAKRERKETKKRKAPKYEFSSLKKEEGSYVFA
jgi:hypothetical protein